MTSISNAARIQSPVTTSSLGTATRVAARPAAPVAELRAPKATPSVEAIIDLNAAPTLPSGAVSTGHEQAELRDQLGAFAELSGDGDGALMWHALSTMANSAMVDQRLASETKMAMQEAKTSAKKSEININEERIAAERASALVSLVGGLSSSLVSGGLGFVGGKFASDTVKGVLEASSKAIGEFSQGIVSYVDKVAGPGRTADEKKIEASRQELMGELASDSIESAKSSYDEAREHMKLALKLLSEHCERATTISATITRI